MVQADLFLMSSDHEGLPNALIEAQGLGIPAVSTRCPHGPGEIIVDGVTGLLAPVGDATSLAAAVVDLLSDPDRLQQMGERSRAEARDRFAAPRVARMWEELLLQEVELEA